MNIAFVPVRCGSKSIPFKNIKFFCGKPLIYWSLKAIEESISIQKAIVATDCADIKNIILEFGFFKVEIFDRSRENASDKSSTESVLLEYLGTTDYNNKDYLFLVQATAPLIQSLDFDNALSQLIDSRKDSLLTCARVKRFFWSDNSKPINYDYANRPRRQDFIGQLVENGSFYINQIGNIVKNKNRLSGEIAIYEMPEYTYIELDEQDDWPLAEALMRKYMLPDRKISDIKLFLSDVDGTLTDAGMYYDNQGNELKRFNTHDGMGFEILRNAGLKIGIVTSEDTEIVARRAKKLKVDYLYQGLNGQSKLYTVKEICQQEGVSLSQVAYIGDDINCKELLQSVGVAACPLNAVTEIKSIPGIVHMKKNGGDGAVREFIEYLIM